MMKLFTVTCILAAWTLVIVSCGAQILPSAYGCIDLAYNVMDCVEFLMLGGTETTPQGSCCLGLKTLVEANSDCLCFALNLAANLGIDLNITRAKDLVSICDVGSPSFANCHDSNSNEGSPGRVIGHSNQNISTDMASLLALKSRIESDPQNILLRNWTAEANVCSWVGVTCDSRYNRVSALDISSMGLVGTIPPEIGNLSFLVYLNMSENAFHGPIPLSIYDMSSLHILALRNNSLSSSLPYDMCKHGLHNLRALRISYNKLYGEIPSSLGHCSQLEYLSFIGNEFSGRIPAEIGNITTLQLFFLAGNNLSGAIPSEIGNLSVLVQTSLRSNKFIGEIPSSICNLRNLQILSLSENKLEGAIPDCLGNLSRSLWILNLNANKLTGHIPSTFTKECRLQSLSLNGNKLEGTLPESIVNCKDLQFVDFGENQIRDTFPIWMETLPELRVLILRSNNFTGTMSLASKTEHPFPKLQVLDISHNEFNGTLPEKYFKNFRGMVDAKVNQTNVYPDAFQYFIELTFIAKGVDLSMQRLLGTLTSIDLSSNKFSGSIPSSIGYLNSLRYLNLSGNSLTGQIPTYLGNMSELESLDLSANNLSGRIPQQFARLTFLSKLNLSYNNLVGQIPRSGQFNTFDNNSYTGNLGLCGFPLAKTCGQSNSPPTLAYEDDEEAGFVNGFGWQAVTLGYGLGLVVGVGLGYFVV